jgi:hypothetical protein
MSDAMSRAARYAAERAAGEHPSQDGADAQRARMSLTADNMSAFVETAIELAMRRGEFDDLPGAGKPLEGLGAPHDPDWWIRRKIERENLTGLGPPALRLRVEDRELEGQLDLLHHEAEVREVLDDFNRRVIEARRQLLGGPPVVTPTRDVEAEVRAWSSRRAARAAASAAAAESGQEGLRRGGRARRGGAGRRRR